MDSQQSEWRALPQLGQERYVKAWPDDAELRGFTLDPRRAKRFKTEATAEAAATDAGKGAVMALLFDVGGQYLVAVPEPHPGSPDADHAP